MHPLEFARRLREVPVALASNDYSQELDLTLDYVQESMIDNWSRQTNENGTPWAPRQGNPSNPPLIKTGAMIGAVTDKDNPGNIRSVSDRAASTGLRASVVPWGPKHQYGTRSYPAREFFFLYRDDRLGVGKPIRQAAGRVIISKMRRG